MGVFVLLGSNNDDDRTVEENEQVIHGMCSTDILRLVVFEFVAYALPPRFSVSIDILACLVVCPLPRIARLWFVALSLQNSMVLIPVNRLYCGTATALRRHPRTTRKRNQRTTRPSARKKALVSLVHITQSLARSRPPEARENQIRKPPGNRRKSDETAHARDLPRPRAPRPHHYHVV